LGCLVWDGVTFEQPELFNVIELTVWRNGGNDYVHVNEWALDSLNPACGQGADLSEDPLHPFFSTSMRRPARVRGTSALIRMSSSRSETGA